MTERLAPSGATQMIQCLDPVVCLGERIANLQVSKGTSHRLDVDFIVFDQKNVDCRWNVVPLSVAEFSSLDEPPSERTLPRPRHGHSRGFSAIGEEHSTAGTACWMCASARKAGNARALGEVGPGSDPVSASTRNGAIPNRRSLCRG